MLYLTGSSSIKVRDERTGTVHLVGFHYISFACGLNINWVMILSLLALLHKWVYWNEATNTYTKVKIMVKGFENRKNMKKMLWEIDFSGTSMIYKCNLQGKLGHWPLGTFAVGKIFLLNSHHGEYVNCKILPPIVYVIRLWFLT